MRVMITGATGFIGGHVTRLLIERGVDVIALVRSPEKLTDHMASFGVPTPTHVIGDMTDDHAVAAALDGADAVVHCAAIVSLDLRDNARMAAQNLAGTRAVLGQAAERGLDPIVHLSSTSALFAPGAGPLTVDHPPTVVNFGYGRAKAATETFARSLQDDGRPVAIVYPSGVIGPPAGDAFGETGEGMSGFLSSGMMPTRRAAVSVIDVRDLAAIIAALLVPGHGPRRVMCAGHFLDMGALAEIYRALTGRRFPIAPVHPSLLRLAGRTLDRIRTRVPFSSPMNEEGMTVVTRWEGTVDSDLAGLDVVLRGATASFHDSILAWRNAGLVTDKQIGALAG